MTMMFLSQVENNHIVNLATSIVSRVEKIAHKSGTVGLMCARVAHILGNMKCVHLDLKQTCRRAGDRRKDR